MLSFGGRPHWAKVLLDAPWRVTILEYPVLILCFVGSRILCEDNPESLAECRAVPRTVPTVRRVPSAARPAGPRGVVPERLPGAAPPTIADARRMQPQRPNHYTGAAAIQVVTIMYISHRCTVVLYEHYAGTSAGGNAVAVGSSTRMAAFWFACTMGAGCPYLISSASRKRRSV